MQLDLISYAEGQRRRDEGMEKAASYPSDLWVKQARTVAEMLAAKYGDCTIDDVLKLCPRPDDVNPNATGSIFKGKRWKCVGTDLSKQASRHAGIIRRWALSD